MREDQTKLDHILEPHEQARILQRVAASVPVKERLDLFKPRRVAAGLVGAAAIFGSVYSGYLIGYNAGKTKSPQEATYQAEVRSSFPPGALGPIPNSNK